MSLLLINQTILLNTIFKAPRTLKQEITVYTKLLKVTRKVQTQDAKEKQPLK
jgi:hypothetical protein